MNRYSCFSFITCILLLFSQMGTAAEQEAFSRLVDIHWLQKHIGDDRVRVLDVRPSAQYRKGHLVHAVNLPVVETFGTEPRKDLVAPMSKIRTLFTNVGVDLSTHVVIYDDGKFIDAARVIWILEANGHTKVSLLNGGYPAWKQSRLPVTNEPVNARPRQFIPQVDPDRVATKFSTRLAIDNPDIVLIDARTPEEYIGKTSSAVRKGHIPSAINIPWEKNFTEENGIIKLKSVEELKAIYAGIDKNKKIITYCNKGKQSALTHFVLREMGYSAAAYDGSWFEWGNDYTLPIENK